MRNLKRTGFGGKLQTEKPEKQHVTPRGPDTSTLKADDLERSFTAVCFGKVKHKKKKVLALKKAKHSSITFVIQLS